MLAARDGEPQRSARARWQLRESVTLQNVDCERTDIEDLVAFGDEYGCNTIRPLLVSAREICA